MDGLDAALRDMQTEYDRLLASASFHHERVAYHDEQAKKVETEAKAVNLAIQYVQRVAQSILYPNPPTPRVRPEQTAAAAAFDEVTPEEEDALVKSFRAVFPPASHNGQAVKGTALFDRAAVRRDVKQYRIGYPLAACHKSLDKFERQAVISTILQHPDFKTYKEAGGFDIGNSYTRNVEHVKHAVETLGIDAAAVINHARVLHNLIYSFGEVDVDYCR